jgi:hypothetical protein
VGRGGGCWGVVREDDLSLLLLLLLFYERQHRDIHINPTWSRGI